MLYEFVDTYRDPIIERARQKLTARPWPSASRDELENGVPLFLTQLSEKLRSESTGAAHSSGAIGATATRHGRDLMALGFTVSQVVHDYGDICQAITELAIEQNAPITTDEFKTLNGCLDTAIAEAVTEHARITAEARSHEEVERSGHIAHEARDLLNTAILAYAVLKQGTVAINGSTGAVLGRSLIGLRDLVDSTLVEIRLAATQQRRVRVAVVPFLNDIAAAGRLHAESRGVHLVVQPGESACAVSADPQVLGSAVTNLLNNAFKFTPVGGRVVLRARANEDRRLLIDVEDECGGIPASVGDPFQAFAERRGRDRTGLGLGLSIARKAVRVHGGDIHIRNAPGKGCVFTIDIPLAADRGAGYAGRCRVAPRSCCRRDGCRCHRERAHVPSPAGPRHRQRHGHHAIRRARSYIGRLDLETSATGMVDWHHQPIEIDDETEPDSGMGAAVRDAVARLGAARQARSGNHQHAAHALRDARVQWVCTRSDRLPRVLSKVSAGSVA